MVREANLQIAVIAVVVVFIWLIIRLVAWIKTKKINTELWCTVFEGLTQGAVRLDHLKNPETVIEKKIRKDGRDKDSLDPDKPDTDQQT
jgi:hypothetical protein